MKQPMEHSAFPSDETLAAFIDGRLDEEMRKKVVTHVADCEECYGTVMAAGAFQREADSGAIQPFSPARKKSALIGLSAAAGVAGLFLFLPLKARYVQHSDTAALVEAANEEPKRSTAARLSLDLEYKPKARPYRGVNEQDSDHWKIESAAAQVLKDTQNDSSVPGQHLLGVALLLDGKYKEAVDALGRAVERQTSASTVAEAISRCRDVALLTDLSVAYGALDGAVSQQIALDAANRAWQLEPKSPKTVWNRAVAIERVHPESAIAAWNDYLAIDHTSSWGREAADYVRLLREGD
jgi:tetratricopeptide (TPR) repeat protein